MRQHRQDGSLYKKSDWSYRKIRLKALKRDNFLCIECLRKGYITPAEETDHIKPTLKGGDHSLDNLQSLCRNCHKEKTLSERYESIGRKRINICEHGTNLNRTTCDVCFQTNTGNKEGIT